MRADDNGMRRLGQGHEHPSSLEARAATFLAGAKPQTGLSDVEIGAIERRLFARSARGVRPRWVPAFAGLVVLLLAGTVMAVVGGWRPRIPFLSTKAQPATTPTSSPATARTAEKPVARIPAAPAQQESEVERSVSLPLPAEQRLPATSRRMARVGTPASTPHEQQETAPSVDALAVEARSLAEALGKWRRDGKAEAALAMLAAHERRYPNGALGVEAKVARAEILLGVSRKDQALAVLDSLALDSVPRSRELRTLRGELRAHAGRCQAARTDLDRVLAHSETDELGARARRARSLCP